MRFVVSSNRMRCLNQVAAIGVLAVIGTGCSSDFMRFDSEQYSSSLASNQTNQQINQYPSGVDPVTTSAISRTSVARPPIPGGYINGVGTTQTAVNPYPSDATTKTVGTTARPTQLSSPSTYNTYNTYNTYQSAPIGSRVKSVKPKTTVVQAFPRAVTPDNVDPITTSALKPAGPAVVKAVTPLTVRKPKPVASASTSGWTGIGGTKITLRDGETLYNISKRYGVPVRELKKVNKITNSDQVTAGQNIIIPTYVYSANAPVSAPDNDPLTRASRATTGMIGEVSPSNIVVPTPSPYSKTSRLYKPGLAPMSASRIRANQTTTTGNPHYTVASGDNLGAIAARHKVSLADLMRANGLSSSNIRVGQKLTIPGQSAYAPAQQSVGLAPISVDRKPTATTPKPYVKPRSTDRIVTGAIDDTAPARTGIETFRWPATGRVMSKFGERRRGVRNDGIDISVPEGTSVKAAENGVVIYSDSELQEYGKLLLIRHADGWVSAYAHNKSLKVKRGEKVRRGQIIAKSGRTGNAERPMIHFELRKDSNPVNPQKYLR